jgi:hypothetical protein
LRRLTSIVLICLLAFNWYGYRLFLHLIEKRSDVALQEKLNKHEYVAQELVELRVPVNLPYLSDWDQFESYEGETTINGHHYRYVKRKLEKGQLILLCIPNQDKDKLKTAGDEYFKQINDLPVEKKAKNGKKILKSNLNDISSLEPDLSDDYHHCVKQKFAGYHLHFSSVKPPPPAQPPNA